MKPEDNYWRAIEFRRPERIPARVSLMPATWKKHRDALEEIVLRHPALFPGFKPGSRDYDAIPRAQYRAGTWTDPWGCVWENLEEGLDGIVVSSPLTRREDVRTFQPPPPGAGLPHGFMFMRLYYLRGFEELMLDFAEEPPELQILIDKVFEYNMGELRRMLEAPPRMMGFGDDLGMQDRFPISPAKFRQYLIPCYRALYQACHEAGSKVYMHSDGRIIDVLPDLIDCGVNVINPQIRANSLPDLVRTCKGRVCVNLDLDRQLFPFCTPEEIDAHVREAVEALSSPEGGLMLVAECEPDVPLENIEAICVALEKHSTVNPDCAER
ncbi:MAG: hypothetical protein GXP31_18975 [Kiritimatiellaeota bacterium]|nr:hypothetical protein [Kiritimatiellota bacterium]